MTLTTTLMRSSVSRDMTVLHKLPVAWMCNLLSFKFENISSARQLLRDNDRAWFKVLHLSALFIVSCNFYQFLCNFIFGRNKTRKNWQEYLIPDIHVYLLIYYTYHNSACHMYNLPKCHSLRIVLFSFFFFFFGWISEMQDFVS